MQLTSAVHDVKSIFLFLLQYSTKLFVLNCAFVFSRMKKYLLTLFVFVYCFQHSFAQYKSHLAANAWVDSVFHSLSKEEKIAQLIVIRAHSNLGPDHVAHVDSLIRNYNVGALC